MINKRKLFFITLVSTVMILMLVGIAAAINPMNISWIPRPTSIVYGTALSSGQLDATATDPTTENPIAGAFAYTDQNNNSLTQGQVLPAGTHTVTANFTTDDPNYNSGVTVTAQITVAQATPKITWSNPADICQSIPLSYDQLDASATNPISGAVLPGTFYYNPDVGTVLREGQNQSLNVTFVQGDSTNYTTASQTVHINVNECPEKHGFFHQTEYSTFLPFQWG
jgi:hypothetical protein